MARKADYDLFCCRSELPYTRIMEQSAHRGNLRYIEEEIGFVCKPCLERLPKAKSPIPRPRAEPGRENSRYAQCVAPRGEEGVSKGSTQPSQEPGIRWPRGS